MTGGVKWITGSAGSGPGQFNNIYGVLMDNWRRIMVADGLNNRTQLLSDDGTYMYMQYLTTGMGGAPFGIVLVRNSLYASLRNTDKLVKYTINYN